MYDVEYACLPLCLCSGRFQTRLVKFSLQITNVCFIAFLRLSINEQTTYSNLYSNLNSKEILLIYRSSENDLNSRNRVISLFSGSYRRFPIETAGTVYLFPWESYINTQICGCDVDGRLLY